MTRIAVVIPVGPEEHHAQWLEECLDSVAAQSLPPDVVLIVDDMHGRDLTERMQEFQRTSGLFTVEWRPPWHLGVTGAFNCGVAMAHAGSGGGPWGPCDLALMLGADDKLEPRVLERIVQTYEGHGGRDGYYWCDVQYQDGTQQALPCNNAAVTTGFMRATGGLPVDASSGAMDAALISALLVHHPEYLLHVDGKFESRFWSRQHPGQETARMNRYAAANAIIRDVFTRHFEAPRWGRYQ